MTAPTLTQPEEAPTGPGPDQGGVGGAVRKYVERTRGGDVGALPAVLSLIVLVIVFAVLRPETFTNAFNFANLLHQAAAVIVISMGLVFVLLLGEIDLSAGWTAGVSAGVMAALVTNHGWPWPLGILACIVTGAVIGTVIGFLVARVGIPSFVVTLALFLALQGVLLKLVGDGGTISVRQDALRAINNDNLPVWVGIVLWIAVSGGYAAIALRRSARRRAHGLMYEEISVVVAKAVVLTVLLGIVTYYLSIDRSRVPGTTIRGVPQVVLLVLFLLVILSFLLGRTAFGRHVYAVGGNAEAARRAGINVTRVKMVCFVLSSSLAAIGGILIASRNNSVSPNTGGADTLLYAVGAAVIGGTSLFGGKGRVLDAILGGLVIALIINGMGLLNKSSSIVYMVTGLVLLVAASVDALSRRRAASTGNV
jgi:D-xylose transport system permease protein